MNRKCLFVYVSAFILFASCRHNSTYGLIRELPDGKFPVINNSSENKFLGYKSYASGDPKDEKWISRVFVYEKYIVNEIAWAYDIAGYVFYENDRKIHFEEIEHQRKLFETYGHFFWGFMMIIYFY